MWGSLGFFFGMCFLMGFGFGVFLFIVDAVILAKLHSFGNSLLLVEGVMVSFVPVPTAALPLYLHMH